MGFSGNKKPIILLKVQFIFLPFIMTGKTGVDTVNTYS